MPGSPPSAAAAPVEIERKWQVDGPLPALPAGVLLQQGYLTDGGGSEVRVRRAGSDHTLTAKRGRGLARAEVELALTAEQFASLWPLTEGRRIEKTRHVLTAAGHPLELDRYAGTLAGLVTVEVEFPSTAAAAAFRPPAWFGRELTGRPGWSNGDLARHGRPTEGPAVSGPR